MDMLFFTEPYWIWLALTILFALIEFAAATSLTTIWFALPAFLLIFISRVIISFKWQMAIFLVFSFAMLIFLRPLAIKKLKVGREKTNVDSLIGKTAVVTRRIAGLETGEIKVSGQYWSARIEGGGNAGGGVGSAVLEAGALCAVARIEGVHAIVTAADTAPQAAANTAPQAAANTAQG